MKLNVGGASLVSITNFSSCKFEETALYIATLSINPLFVVSIFSTSTGQLIRSLIEINTSLNLISNSRTPVGISMRTSILTVVFNENGRIKVVTFDINQNQPITPKFS